MAELGNLQYNLRTLVRESGVYTFRLAYASGATTVSKDLIGLLNTPVDTTTGVIDLTFTSAWAQVFVAGTMYIGTTDDTQVRIDAKTEGTSPAMTLNVETAGSPANTDGDIEVTLFLQRTDTV